MVAAGKPHIEIRAHLDLTVLDLIPTATDFEILGFVPETVKSIRVRFWFLPPRSCHSIRHADIMSAMHRKSEKADNAL